MCISLPLFSWSSICMLAHHFWEIARLVPRSCHYKVSLGKYLFVFGDFINNRCLFEDLHILNLETGAWTEAAANGLGSSSRFFETWEMLLYSLEATILFNKTSNMSHNHKLFSSAYIQLKTPQDVFDFSDMFYGHIFVNEKCSQFEAEDIFYIWGRGYITFNNSLYL